MGVTGFSGLPLSPLCDPIQEGEGPFRGYILQVFGPEFLTELGKNQPIRPDRVFFRVTLVILQPKFCCL